ncbi:MAG: riboflavin biosynthesis protein RibF [Candidatus Glassbacteria bacterium]|nr:riboflavin biosynthesis protein RibF [Candidatus Glassbacteria bacterium]
MEITGSQFSVLPEGVRTAVTVGTFDGLHLGHLRILEKLLEVSRRRGLHPLVATFDPHPRHALQPRSNLKLLTTLEKKLSLMAEMGVEYVALVKFTRAFSLVEPAGFVIDYLLNRLRMAALVMGYDHTFGRDRSGDERLLAGLSDSHGFYLLKVPPVIVDGAPVSSSRVRRALEQGDLPAAARLLGRYYSFDGRVVPGAGRGTGLGHPTANLVAIGRDKQLFPEGIYAAAVDLDGRTVPGVLHYGPRPTFEDDTKTLEINLFGFSGDLYGCTLGVFVLERIRPVAEFDSPQALVRQMDLDDSAAKKIFARINDSAFSFSQAV